MKTELESEFGDGDGAKANLLLSRDTRSWVAAKCGRSPGGARPRAASYRPPTNSRRNDSSAAWICRLSCT